MRFIHIGNKRLHAQNQIFSLTHFSIFWLSIYFVIKNKAKAIKTPATRKTAESKINAGIRCIDQHKWNVKHGRQLNGLRPKKECKQGNKSDNLNPKTREITTIKTDTEKKIPIISLFSV